MHEAADDLATLQRLLDRSYAAAGAHLRSIVTPERRFSAGDLCALLTGVRVLNLATVTAAGHPRVGPVDGLFYRGQFYFGSAPQSVRFRHIRARPHVSAAYTVGEELAVIVHGRAVAIDVYADPPPPLRAYLIEVYPQWEAWWGAGGAAYARIDAETMFAWDFRGIAT
jgi:uncharacterized pyridoxamine 5'-phosphate oxidase family protein